MIRAFCINFCCHAVFVVLTGLFAAAHYHVLFHDPHTGRSGGLFLIVLLACGALMLISGGIALLYPAFQYQRSFTPDRHVTVPIAVIALTSICSVALAVFVHPIFVLGYIIALAVVAASQAIHER